MIPPRQDVPRAARLIVSMSDIEMGAGGPTDDFPASDWLASVLDAYGEPYADLCVDLVLNGDVLDFLKTPVDGAWPRHITAEIGLAKLAAIEAAHGAFFDALGRFLARPGRRVLWTTGNHDFELEFTEVRQAIARRIGASPQFVSAGTSIGDAWFEHGHGRDPLFRFPHDAPLVDGPGGRIIDLPWGAIGLLDVVIPLQGLLGHLDRLKPREQVFELMPEVREFLMGIGWRYWTRDYWTGWFRGRDPVKKMRWSMVKEIASRLGNADPVISVSSAYRPRLKQGPHRVIVLGHEHQASWWSWGDRKLLVTGAMRHEFLLEAGGTVQRQLPKVWAELYQDAEGRTLRSHLVEADAPPPPVGWLPASIFDVLPEVRRRLAPAAERKQDAADQAAQEAKEDREPAE